MSKPIAVDSVDESLKIKFLAYQAATEWLESSSKNLERIENSMRENLINYTDERIFWDIKSARDSIADINKVLFDGINGINPEKCRWKKQLVVKFEGCDDDSLRTITFNSYSEEVNFKHQVKSGFLKYKILQENMIQEF